MRKQKGFTLIELLVVISIIGLLSTLAIVSLNNARQKSRDAKRVADVKQMQSALELYFNDNNTYPTHASIAMGTTGALTLSSAGLADTATNPTYMGSVPSNPLPNPGWTNGYYYYSADGTTYSIQFNLEGGTGQLPAGTRTATPAGIQ